ncbi:acyl transferase/acyl hydrolase/lysophospholipase, partial [Mycena rebaudengoi]
VSLIKVALALRHRQVTPHIGIKTALNPRLGNLSASGIVVPKSLAPLTTVPGEEKIIISVNSFGAQSSNANILISEHLPESEPCRQDVDSSRSYYPVMLSGQSHTPFQLLVDRLPAHLAQNLNIGLGSLSYTPTGCRVDYPACVAFSMSTIDELKAQLGARPRPADPPKHASKIGFVLGGNGSQFRAIGKTLYDSSGSFRRSVDECREALKSSMRVGEPGLMDADGDVDVLMGAVSGTIDPLAHTFQSTLASSAGIIAVEYALGTFWAEWGVRPSVILGHSLGEYAGLVLVRALSLVDARLAVTKCRAMYEAELHPESHGMLAIGCAVEEALLLSRDVQSFLWPARRTRETTFASRSIPGSFTWYSSYDSYVSAQAARVIAASGAITPSAVVMSMILNTDGSVLPPGQYVPSGYLGGQMKSAVRWDRCVAHSLCADVDIWIELSPKSILMPLLRSSSTLPGRTFLPTLNGAVDAWSTVTKALGCPHSNTLVARGTFSASTRSLMMPTSQHLIRARKRLLKDTRTSSVSSAAIAGLLDGLPGRGSRAAVASECDEAISIVPLSKLNQQQVVPEADGATPPRLTPFDIRALFLSPRLVLLAGRPISLSKIDSLQIYSD